MSNKIKLHHCSNSKNYKNETILHLANSARNNYVHESKSSKLQLFLQQRKETPYANKNELKLHSIGLYRNVATPTTNGVLISMIQCIHTVLNTKSVLNSKNIMYH